METLKARGNKYYQDVVINENFLEENDDSPVERTEHQLQDMDIQNESQTLERKKDKALEEDDQREDKDEKANGENESEDENDTISKSVKEHQSKQSSNTFLMTWQMKLKLILGNLQLQKKLKEMEPLSLPPVKARFPPFYFVKKILMLELSLSITQMVNLDCITRGSKS